MSGECDKCGEHALECGCKMEWISIEDRVPTNNQAYNDFWVWDGTQISMCLWAKIDLDYKNEFKQTDGYWFGYMDGGEYYSADNVKKWMPVLIPNEPDGMD